MFVVGWLFVCIFYINDCQESEQCLSSPPELELSEGTDNDGNTIYSGTLRFDAKKFTTEQHGYPASFTSRIYNGILPGPTIRLKRGKMYHISVYNDLGPEHPDDPAIINSFHHSNTTNLHTHGLHISPQSPSDDTTLSISPGDYHEYIYYIPCQHHGGTNFYHPHHHGSTALQVAGGAAGALIVDDDDGTTEQLPDWLLSMDELVLMIQFIDLKRLVTFRNIKYEQLTETDGSDLFYLVNGVYQASICLNVNVWTRLRIIYSDVTFDTEIKFGDTEICTIYLLAKDGVYIDNGPRFLSTNSLYFTQSSRVDIAIKCNKIGKYRISGWDHDDGMMGMMGGNTHNVEAVTIGNIFVNPLEDGDDTKIVDIAEFKPLRPRHLRSLLDYDDNDIDNFWNVRLRGMMGYTINDKLFEGTDAIQMEIGVNQINEYTVTMEGMMDTEMMKKMMGSGMMERMMNKMGRRMGGMMTSGMMEGMMDKMGRMMGDKASGTRMMEGMGEGMDGMMGSGMGEGMKGGMGEGMGCGNNCGMGGMHKIHIHVNHFQIMDGTVLSGSDPNFTLVGDWLDTVGYNARIRFWSDTFDGKIMLHCHILAHSDLGMMAIFRVNDGCNALDSQCIDKNSDCKVGNDGIRERIEFVDNMGNSDIIDGSGWIRNDVYTIFILMFIGVVFSCILFVIWFMLKRNTRNNKKKVNYGAALC